MEESNQPTYRTNNLCGEGLFCQFYLFYHYGNDRLSHKHRFLLFTTQVDYVSDTDFKNVHVQVFSALKPFKINGSHRDTNAHRIGDCNGKKMVIQYPSIQWSTVKTINKRHMAYGTAQIMLRLGGCSKLYDKTRSLSKRLPKVQWQV